MHKSEEAGEEAALFICPVRLLSPSWLMDVICGRFVSSNLCHTTSDQSFIELCEGFDSRLRGELVKDCPPSKNRMLSCINALLAFVFLPQIFVLSLLISWCQRKLRSILF